MSLFSEITNNNLDMLISYFPTTVLTTIDLSLTILEAIGLLEMRAGVQVTEIVGMLNFY